MRQPNFLLFMTDQHRADHLGCYGNPIVQTPNIDGIAERGRRFDKFYVACPICMPNRIAMMTGRMPGTNGSRHNGIPLDLEAVTFVDLLRSAGYKTGLIGKSHLQNMTGRPVSHDASQQKGNLAEPPEDLGDAVRERRIGPAYEAEMMKQWAENPDREIRLPYYGFDHVRFANGHGDQVHGHYDRWLRDRHANPEALRGPDAAMETQGLQAPQAWRTSVPEELYPTCYVADETLSFLDEVAKGDENQPFFIQCSFPDPHHPFTPPGRYFDLYDPNDIPLPETFKTIGKDEHPFLASLRYDAINDKADDAGPRPFVTTDADATRQIIALTYGMITMVDDAIGRVLEGLRARGLDENTIVIFTSDHGDFMGDHGLMLKHGLHYDGVLRVPFIWSEPDEPSASVSQQLGGTIDIGTTILARAGLAPQNGSQGMDIISETGANALASRQGMLVEEDELGIHLGRDEGMRTRSFVTGRWRLSLFDGMDYGELFDRELDPGETQNLWNSPAHAQPRAELMELMLREMIRLGDTAPRPTHVA